MPQDITRHKTDTKSLISLGSNVASALGTPLEIVQAAKEALAGASVKLLSASRLYHTPCVPRGAGADYVNAAVQVSSSLDATQMLALLHEIEQSFDRKREARWAARTLDLDLLDHGGAIAPDLATWRRWHELPFEEQKERFPDRLILPHPRIQDRAFVIVPLMDIVPAWRHPVSGRLVREMAADLTSGDLAGITPID